jgi:queuine tRNA-ribosyltransferase
MKFDYLHKSQNSKARAGVLHTDHGSVETPIFMPVGTVGSVKGIAQQHLTQDVKAQIILGNTYHLYLRPGTEVLEQAGGLHQFIGWDRPMLTDSGGYQVYSLSQRRKITEEGVQFASHIDGSKHVFTPESATDIQRSIGADIIMAFDECTPYPCEYKYAKSSMEMTHRWLDRCLTRFDNTPDKYGYRQTLAPIVQGSVYKDLRTISAEYIASRDRSINAIGGLAVGEPHEILYDMTAHCCDILPEDKPRYLMGVGTPENLLECIHRGVDMFDCVMPTRNARHGLLYTTRGIINIKNLKWRNDFSVIDQGLDNDFSTRYTKAYLRHLLQSGELLAAQIASIQNLSFYLWLVNTARQHILDDSFVSWKESILPVIMRRL